MPPRPTPKRTRNALRCMCSRQPLLALYGIDEKGKLYVHQKVFKGDRIFGEIVVSPAPGTQLQFHCRECLRWMTVMIRPETVVPKLVVTDEPAVLGKEN